MQGLLGRLRSSSGHKLRSLNETVSFSENHHGMATLRVPELVPSPAQDCERLKQAFDGLGTDENTVIWILGHRNASQKRKIKDTYQQLYNESLISRLNSELSGDFGKAVILWTYDPHERDAKLANDALKMHKRGVKHLKVIVEIACTTSPHHLVAVRQAYCSLYDCSLEEDIASTVSAPLVKLLLGLVSSYRFDEEVVDLAVADSEASTLHEGIEKKLLDHDLIVWILSTRNIFQLRETFKCYKQKYGKSIDQDIKSCGNGDLESLLKMVIVCIESPDKHFAEVIRDSIVGMGTDEDSLSRAIVTRAEVDAMRIREQYSNMFKASLDDDVIGDTSGDYKNFLLTLLGASF